MSKYENGELVQNLHGGREINGVGGVILGVDGGATSTVCVCLPLFSDPASLPDPLPVLGRAVAGCSNHNSVGGNFISPFCCYCVSGIHFSIFGTGHSEIP